MLLGQVASFAHWRMMVLRGAVWTSAGELPLAAGDFFGHVARLVYARSETHSSVR